MVDRSYKFGNLEEAREKLESAGCELFPATECERAFDVRPRRARGWPSYAADGPMNAFTLYHAGLLCPCNSFQERVRRFQDKVLLALD